jgi:sec-independent protein translocase protein TatA
MTSLFALFGTLGTWELLIIGLIVLLLFGNRLPSVMRSLGRGLVEFKKGASGVDEDAEAGAPKTNT